jgi:pSer/pThr/pTyr-binding forkhead associated (FHA) protein
MKLSLLVLTSGKQEGKTLPITLAQFVIGRDPQCQLRPASPLISKRHCAFLQRDGKVFLRDFDSTNGTFLNGQKVVGEVELRQGDRVKVGPIELAVQLEGKPADRLTPPPPSRPAKGEKPEPESEAEKNTETLAALAATKPDAPTVKAKAPAKAPAKDEDERGTSDDDVADMLLSLQDDSDSGSAPNVPEGTTELEIRVPSGTLDGSKDAAKDAKGKDKAKADTGNTVSAAKSILEKMMRRPR